MFKEELDTLQAIRQDVRTLVEGPWRESRQLLDMAAHSDGSIRRGYLLDARNALIRAHSHEPLATPRPWGKRMSHIAIAGTTTEGGRKLMQLHRMQRDVQEYRRVCKALNPKLDMPEYELRVDLSKTRRALISWEPV